MGRASQSLVCHCYIVGVRKHRALRLARRQEDERAVTIARGVGANVAKNAEKKTT